MDIWDGGQGGQTEQNSLSKSKMDIWDEGQGGQTEQNSHSKLKMDMGWRVGRTNRAKLLVKTKDGHDMEFNEGQGNCESN